MTVVAHFIDENWEMCQQLVAFEHFPTPHNAQTTASILNRVISRNHLKRNFFALVGDSAKTNTAGVRALSETLAEEAGIKWSYTESFFHCSAHVFNLIAEAICTPFVNRIKVNGDYQDVDDDVTEGLETKRKASGKMLHALGKLSAMSRLSNQSPLFMQEWSRLCRLFKMAIKKLITAAPTRWNSRYEQIDRALEYKVIYEGMIESFPEKYRQFSISEAEWSLLKWLHAILSQLNLCSKFVSVTNRPSIAFMVPCFSKLTDVLENVKPPAGIENPAEKVIREAAVELARSKLAGYYDHTRTNPYYTFAMCKNARSVNSTNC